MALNSKDLLKFAAAGALGGVLFTLLLFALVLQLKNNLASNSAWVVIVFYVIYGVIVLIPLATGYWLANSKKASWVEVIASGAVFGFVATVVNSTLKVAVFFPSESRAAFGFLGTFVITLISAAYVALASAVLFAAGAGIAFLLNNKNLFKQNTVNFKKV